MKVQCFHVEVLPHVHPNDLLEGGDSESSTQNFGDRSKVGTKDLG